jgi:hypothetical protein
MPRKPILTSQFTTYEKPRDHDCEVNISIMEYDKVQSPVSQKLEAILMTARDPAVEMVNYTSKDPNHTLIFWASLSSFQGQQRIGFQGCVRFANMITARVLTVAKSHGKRLCHWPEDDPDVPARTRLYQRWDEGEIGVIVAGNMMVRYDDVEALENLIL